jgi:hypothetical protein
MVIYLQYCDDTLPRGQEALYKKASPVRRGWRRIAGSFIFQKLVLTELAPGALLTLVAGVS